MDGVLLESFDRAGLEALAKISDQCLFAIPGLETGQVMTVFKDCVGSDRRAQELAR